METTEIDRITEMQHQIREMAAALARTNPDAAEELGKWLVEFARQQKRFAGFAVQVRYNAITEKVEITMGE